MNVEDLLDDFEFIDDWEDRYRYVIELGKALPPLDEALRTDSNKVPGCVSQVWLATHIEDAADPKERKLSFTGDSDAMIVRGLVAILVSLYNHKTAEEIIKIDAPGLLADLGLKDHLTPQRSNGLSAMVGRIRADATKFLQQS